MYIFRSHILFLFFITIIHAESLTLNLLNDRIAEQTVASIKKTLSQPKPTILYFYTPSCRFCRHTKPLIESLQKKYADKINFITIDIKDATRVYKNHFNIETVPFIGYFKNGSEVARHGSQNLQLTLEYMDYIVKTKLLNEL